MQVTNTKQQITSESRLDTDTTGRTRGHQSKRSPLITPSYTLRKSGQVSSEPRHTLGRVLGLSSGVPLILIQTSDLPLGMQIYIRSASIVPEAASAIVQLNKNPLSWHFGDVCEFSYEFHTPFSAEATDGPTEHGYSSSWEVPLPRSGTVYSPTQLFLTHGPLSTSSVAVIRLQLQIFPTS